MVLRTSWVPGMFLARASDVRQDLAGGGLQVCKAQLGQVPLDGLLLAVDVRVGCPQAGRDLPDARDDVLGLQGLVAAAVGAGRGEHVSVLLQVDRGPEQVVPDRKPEGPVAPELRLHAPLRGGGPGVNVHLGRAALAPGSPAPLTPAPAAVVVFLGHGVSDVRAGSPARKAEAKGDGEVEGLELVQKLVAGPDL